MYHDFPFTRFAKWISRAAGHPATFAVAVFLIQFGLLPVRYSPSAIVGS